LTLSLSLSHSLTLAHQALAASGNTFAAGDASGMPKVEASAGRVVFPPVQLGASSVTTVALMNHADTPVRFDFAAALSGRTGAGSVFTVTPLAGVVSSRIARWVTLRARWVTLRARWVTVRARWVT
jgi:hypothetical protein